MQVNLKDQVAMVTGGAQGIGEAIVQSLCANGARVAIVDIDGDTARQTARRLQSAPADVAAFEADVSDRTAIDDVVSHIADRFGAIGILINNAGINSLNRAPIHEYSPEVWEEIVRVDLTGLFITSQAVVPNMLAGGGGRIVNIASVAGMVPLRLQSGFVAAKAGAINLTRSMALELGPQGILVNAVAPGSTLTRGTEALFYGADGKFTENTESLLSHIPLGRPARVEEIAHAVLFLAAPESSYVNGAVLTVDGGWTAGYTRDW